MIDHISLAVSDLERSVAFYEPLLAAVGLGLLVRRPTTVGFGKTYPMLWLNVRPEMIKVAEGSGAHVALRARSIDEVAAFHAAAIAGGGRSESVPSLRPHDRVRYYATFVVDPDGNRLEAVTFLPDEGS